MKKAKGTMTVTIPGTGRQLQVPKGLSGDALARHVDGVLQAEATDPTPSRSMIAEHLKMEQEAVAKRLKAKAKAEDEPYIEMQPRPGPESPRYCEIEEAEEQQQPVAAVTRRQGQEK